MQLSLKARNEPIRTVSFVPPMISTGNPDISEIHSAVQKAIDQSEGKSSKKKSKSADSSKASGANKHAGTTGGSIGNLKQGYAANQATDLSSAC
jgi:tRNA pseudouridine-54 N-methylase